MTALCQGIISNNISFVKQMLKYGANPMNGVTNGF